MTQSVRLLGTSLELRKGQTVTITPARNLPQGGFFAAPVSGKWGDDSILVTSEDFRPKMDTRYIITRESVGLARPVYVVRFCGDWLTPNARSYAFTRQGALDLALAHRLAFCEAAGIES